MKLNKGFTYIELLVLVAIISILASIVAVSYQGAKEKAEIERSGMNCYTEKTQCLNKCITDYNSCIKK